MTDKSSIESAAASILQRAVALDKKSRFTEALVCYQEGLQILIDIIKDVDCKQKKENLRKKADEYFGRAEQLKKLIEDKKNHGTYHEVISIENDSKGHGYETLIGRFLTNDVTFVTVKDAYIRNHSQCTNFLRFCELLVRKCSNLKKIHLTTGSDQKTFNDQLSWLQTTKNSLETTHQISLDLEFSQTLHDREIVLSNGWIIKIGRGLNYFKPPENKFAIGAFDCELRPCHETQVDIYHRKDVKHSFG